jgi:hypothetical protein
VDAISADMDTTEIDRLFADLRVDAQTYVNAAAQETGDAIVREAQARLARQLGPTATGATVAGIGARPAADGNGVVVFSERDASALVPMILERGSKKGKSGHANYARPYFWVSAELEAGAHYRRIGEALGRAIAEKGLGL